MDHQLKPKTFVFPGTKYVKSMKPRKAISKELNVIWRIKTLDLASFKSLDVHQEHLIEVDPNTMNFGMEAKVNIKPEQKEVAVNFRVSIFSDATQSIKLGSISTLGEYVIENFDEVAPISDDNQNRQLPKVILATLVGITLSSTRGMLRLLSKGTLFEKGIIPIVDPMMFLTPHAK